MGQSIVVADAFTDRPFSGNPAAVCVLPGPADEEWMQKVAREMNLSETAFLHREVDPESGALDAYRLRWFTPNVEVDLCGHATLATAHVLWSEGHLPPDTPARFLTRSGPLSAVRQGEWIELDFPATPATESGPGSMAASTDPATIATLFKVQAAAVCYSPFDLLVELESEQAVRAYVPDYNQLSLVPVRGVIVTGPGSTDGVDFVSRFFAPRVGVNEDPVCGSAHCCLGPYWGSRLGKTELTALQVSARGGTIRIRLRGDRVTLAGQAVTTLRGELADGAGA